MTPLRVYLLGLVLLSLAGFCSPWWWLGWAPLGGGLVWAAYDLIEVKDGDDADTPGASPR